VISRSKISAQYFSPILFALISSSSRIFIDTGLDALILGSDIFRCSVEQPFSSLVRKLPPTQGVVTDVLFRRSGHIVLDSIAGCMLGRYSTVVYVCRGLSGGCASSIGSSPGHVGGCTGQGCAWSQMGIPAALARRTALVLPGLPPRMNAAHPSAPKAIISALRRYSAARPYRRQSAGCASIW
jgi:hypothetical protein